MKIYGKNRPFSRIGILACTLLVTATSFSANAALTKKSLADSGYWGGTLLPNNAAISASELNTIYNRFVNNYIVDAGNNMARVKWGAGGALRDGSGNVSKDAYATASEGMGYGMLITAYGDDQTRFDKLYNFYKKAQNNNPGALMPWLVWSNASPVTNNICYGGANCNGAGGGGPATDGDIDIAMALFVASDKWGDNGIDYRAEAIDIVNELHDNWLYWCPDDGGTWVVKPFDGSSWGASPYDSGTFNPCTDEIDPSYSIPAFFRFFAEVAASDGSVKNDNDRWNSAARDLYDRLLDRKKAGPNGDKTFVPDWMTLNGSSTDRNTNYGSDASRIPWLVTMDYAWYGTSKAVNWNRRLINDLVDNSNNGDLSGINSDILQSTGGSTTTYNGRSFSGGFAVAAMLYNWYPANANNYTAHWVNETINGSLAWNIGANGYENAKNDYYGMALSTLYALTLTGNTYKPSAN